MDINDKIAARRAELAREEREVKAAQDAIIAREKAERDAAAATALEERRRQTAQALDDAAARLSTDNTQIVREGDHLTMKAALPPIDIAGLMSNEIEHLLRVRAREMWTVKDNWLVIGGIASAATVVSIGVSAVLAAPVAGILTMVCVGAGIFSLRKRAQLNKRYFDELCALNPGLVEALNGGMPDRPAEQ